ncbi:hypothetical protein [Rhodanobacter sp. FW106-PBR-R2A-1-13]|uniref:hypothetical protein n=1 Tax=Rhodanobacter sp. FW106-PBR-R2A-1-13 TaxID=3454845 RepID=UPI0034E4A417
MQSALSLFPTSPRRPRAAAAVTVDGHAMGVLLNVESITPAMRAHGVTASDVLCVLRGRRRSRHFLCNGDVLIRAVALPVPGRRAALPK